MQCRANKKRGGKCGSKAMQNGYCRMHGGKSLKGVASPTFKTGKYSKYVPKGLGDKLAQVADDEHLTSLREEVRLLDARRFELLEMLSTGEAGLIWNELASASAAFRATKNVEILNKLLMLIDQGAAEWQTWAHIESNIEQRSRLTEKENKRLVQMQQMMSAEQVLLLMHRIADIVKSNVGQNEYNKIQAEINSAFIGGGMGIA